ncbi:MAG: YhcH/YjgK/YiaL family protein [Elusimicrobiota bacterium]|jgi:YhcH/YjgK/YiaL family protein|nr:YhcH/YjgK/YiaL family protein [Elusimicrobiota bacterium]
MIIGNMKNIDFYSALFPKAKKGFDFLKGVSESTENKVYELADGIKAQVFMFKPAAPADRKLETHNEYIDIQFIVSGSDIIGIKPARECNEAIFPYNKERDITFFKGIPNYSIQIKTGDFAIIFPDEAHAPSSGEGDRESKKVVVKVRKDLLGVGI